MPQLKKTSDSRKTSKGIRPTREFVYTNAETQFLKRLGLKINKKLADMNKSAEWLAFQSEIARSTVMEIIAGRSNPRVLTLKTISFHLGFKSVQAFFDDV